MSARYLVGFDLGGSGARCLVIDTESGQSTTSTRRWTHPRAPQHGHWALDLDVDLVWRVVGETCHEAMQQAGATPDNVAGIGITSIRHGTVLIDRDGAVLFATPTMDARAGILALQIGNDRGDEIYRRTGHWPNPILSAVRLMWLAQTDPGLLKDARATLSVSDWLGYRLTGNVAFTRSQAAETMALDLESREWAEDLLASYGLPRRIFPQLVDAGAVVGELTNAAASHLGLRAGTPVIAGGADTQCALLATGAATSGQFGVVAGTTTSVMLTTSRPIIDPKKRLWTDLHVVPGLYVLESNAASSGETLAWVAAAWYADLPDPVAALCAEAAHASPGAGGIASTVGARAFSASDLSLPVDNLTFSATSMVRDTPGRALMARAVLEGMAYAVRLNLERVREVSGQAPETLRLAGGMSRSALWGQILADVTRLPINVAGPPEASALGAAICAGVGSGLFGDAAAGAERLTTVTRSHAPQPASVDAYESRYARWLDMREGQAETNEIVAEAIVEELLQEPDEQELAPTFGFRPQIYVSADVDGASLDRLRQLGDVTFASYRQESRLLVGEDLWEALEGYHVFVTEVDVVDAEALQKLPDLRLILACRGNPVNVDLAACSAASVPVVNTPGRNADAVADLALALMLMLARKLPEATAFLRRPGGEAGDMGRMGMAHESFQGDELWHKTVGLVGAGAVGRGVIRRLLPFGARIVITDPAVSTGEAALLGATKVSFDRLLAESDFVSLHAPVTNETLGMIGEDALAHMKDGAFLINTARAALIDDRALAQALTSGKLGGAALDVFSIEPPGADDPLLACPNVIATPHVAGNTHDVAAHQGAVVVAEIERMLAGERPQHLLNPETMAGFSWTGERRVATEALERLAAGPGPAVSDLQVEARTVHAGEAAVRPVSAQMDPVDPALQTRAQTEREPASNPAAPTERGLFSRFARRFRGTAAAAPEPQPASRDAENTIVRILDSFTAAVAADPKMADFAKGKDVTMLFTLRDLALDFYLSFIGGRVSAGMGTPPQAANVHLKMSAATLDGIFTGQVNGMRAAMTGKLSFSGDTSKAMAFQRLQGDLGKLYTAAREAIGDPGDLTRIGGPAATESGSPSPIPAVATSAAIGPAPAHRVGDVRDDILEAVRDLYAAQLITPTGGNVSARVDGNPDQLWITPSAVFKGSLQPEMLVRIDLQGRVMSDNGYSASSERHVHCAIYRERPDVQAIVHSHAPQAMLMALTGTRFLPISAEAAFLGDVPVVPFIRPGTTELADAVAAAIGGHGSAALMQNHGLVVAGSSVRRAADVTFIIESTAEKLLTCRLLGVEPPVLPDDVVAEMRELGEMIA